LKFCPYVNRLFIYNVWYISVGMTFQFTVSPVASLSNSNSYVTHHHHPRELPPSLPLQSPLGSPPPQPLSPNHITSPNLTSPASSHMSADSFHRHPADLHSPTHIKPDPFTHYSSVLHPCPPLTSSVISHSQEHSHMYIQHHFTPGIIPSHASVGKNVGMLTGQRHGMDLQPPPVLSHTPVILAE